MIEPPESLDLLQLLPHRRTMLWLDRVVETGALELACEARVTADRPLVRAGRVGSVVAIEYIAQTAAALLGLLARRAGHAPGGGYLVAIRQLDLDVAAFAVGDVLTVRATQRFGDDRFASFEGRVDRSGRRAAHALLNVLRSPG